MSGGRFGAVDGAALVVTTVVGAGIFTVPAYVARLAGSGTAALALWGAGGLIALCGALCYAELAARFPRGGAEYVYIREAFGPAAGFLSGWTSFVAGFSGAIAAAAVGFARYLAALVPAADAHVPVVALALIALFTAVSLTGVRASAAATNILALVIVAGVVALIAAGAGYSGADGAQMAPAAGGGALGALVPIFFTYSGWNAAAYVAGEFRDPRRDVPRALVAGTLVVTALYVALNAAVLEARPLAALAVSAAPVADAAAAMLGERGSTLVGVLVLAALASSVCAMVITGPRIYLEMARDGALPPLFGRTSARDGVPVAAVVAQSAWSALLVMSGTFEEIVTYTGFALVLFSGLAVAAVFVLRRRLGAPAGYAVPGYPYVPAAFVCLAAVMAAASLRHAPGPSMVGLALIASGLPVRWLLRALRPAPARLA